MKREHHPNGVVYDFMKIENNKRNHTTRSHSVRLKVTAFIASTHLKRNKMKNYGTSHREIECKQINIALEFISIII